MYTRLIVILLVVEQLCQLCLSSCIMDGPCVEGSLGDINCARSFKPVPLKNSSMIKVFKDMCPSLASESLLCCNDKQVDRLHTIFALPGNMMRGCPSCFENFKRIFCSFACSPEQSEFLNITGVDAQNQSRILVKEITYFIEDRDATRLFDSCKKVQMSGFTVMQFMCGSYGQKACSSRRFLNFLGSDAAHSGMNPFQIDFEYLKPSEKVKIGNRIFRGVNVPMTTCDTPDGVDMVACSCSDCERSCVNNMNELPPFYGKEETWKIFGYNAMIFLVVLGSCCLVSIILIILVIRAFSYIGYPPPRSVIRRAGDRCLHAITNFLQLFVFLETFGTYIEGKLKSAFWSWGIFVAHHPLWVMSISFLASLACSMGLLYFEVTTDPVSLWVSTDSRARQDMKYFNEHFRPFYRTQQIIVVPNDQSSFTSQTLNLDGGNVWGPVFRQEFLLEVQKLQQQVESIEVDNGNGIRSTLEDVCVSPLRPLKHFNQCVNDLADESCYGEYGGPLIPVTVALGDMEVDGNGSLKLYTAKALVITIPMTNNIDETRNQAAVLWEREFLNLMKEFHHENMTVAYRAERSVEDELSRGSKSDKLVVGLSYLIMFIYISLALGDIRSCPYLMVDTKITLGVFGVLIVFVSMTASIGIFCYSKFPASLIVVQVLPFLILAVGVDNVFLLVQTFQSDLRQPEETTDTQIGRVVGEIAPSMLLSSTSMAACFFIGALSAMPVIRTFALYAGVSIVINFFLQMTAFLAAFSLDAKRQEANRWDLCWCVVSTKITSLPGIPRSSLLTRFFKNVYAPFLMKGWVRITVLVIFTVNLLVSASAIYNLDIGFEERDAMPIDSYLQKYFQYLNRYLSFGPPLYFVITEYPYMDPKARLKICGRAGCDNDSVVSYLTQMSRFSNVTYIAASPSSWIDDYVTYMRSDSCCKVFQGNGTFCPSALPNSPCQSCFDPPVVPKGNDFYLYAFSFFLEDVPSKYCPVAGRSLHKDAVQQLKSTVAGSPGVIGATYVMTYHTALKKSRDHILALQYSRYISEKLQTKLRENGTSEARVIPYSLTHVFYEQYLTVWRDALRGLSFSLIAIFVVVLIFMGLDLFSATIVTLTIVMIVVSVMGLMYWWKVALNAVSLVNLVVAVGISVEFCSHLTLAFSRSTRPTRVERAQEAIGKLGRSIISGITLTDSGVLLLALARLPVFSVYYFRMYLGIILYGTLHSIVFLPVLLSWVGPPTKQPTSRQEIFNASAARKKKSRPIDMAFQDNTPVSIFKTQDNVRRK